MNESFLLTGSNLGNRPLNLQKSLTLLSKDVRILTVSSIYESESWGREDQPNFLNQVLRIETEKEPLELLKITQGIEDDLGRKRIEKWGSRLIDIDILFFENEIVHDDELVIPHPEIANRRFTLAPLAEIAPQLIHPILGKDIQTLLSICKDPLKVWKTDQDMEATSASL